MLLCMFVRDERTPHLLISQLLSKGFRPFRRGHNASSPEVLSVEDKAFAHISSVFPGIQVITHFS